MTHRVVITGLAERDTIDNHAWWAKHRSREQANHWLEGVYAAMLSLGTDPERCGYAVEQNLREEGVRQLLFGIGRRKTHRIVFSIDGPRVVIYRVMGLRQEALEADDLVE